MTDSAASFPRRHWLQFSVRTLLVAMLVVAAYFAGRMPMVRRAELAEQQRDAALKKAEDTVVWAQQIQTRLRWVFPPSPVTNPLPTGSALQTPAGSWTVPAPPPAIDGIDAGMIFDALEAKQRWQSQVQAIDK